MFREPSITAELIQFLRREATSDRMNVVRTQWARTEPVAEHVLLNTELEVSNLFAQTMPSPPSDHADTWVLGRALLYLVIEGHRLGAYRLWGDTELGAVMAELDPALPIRLAVAEATEGMPVVARYTTRSTRRDSVEGRCRPKPRPLLDRAVYERVLEEIQAGPTWTDIDARLSDEEPLLGGEIARLSLSNYAEMRHAGLPEYEAKLAYDRLNDVAVALSEAMRVGRHELWLACYGDERLVEAWPENEEVNHDDPGSPGN